jgi:tetratricopeptide (TPR) repeat protein
MRAGGCPPLMLCATSALAEAPPVEDPATAAARGHFQAGQVYFQEGDLKRALASFREAARHVDSPALDFNIARTHDRLGDAARAVSYYERYLARRPDAQDRAEVDARIAELRPRVGTLTLVSRVPGATLLVDEEPADAGKPIRITEGAHRVVASKDGWYARTVEARVPGGGAVTLEIDPLPGAAAASAPTVKESPVKESPAPKKRSLWWVGVIVGGAVAVGVAATAGALAPRRAVEEGLVDGNVPPGFQRIP